MQIVLSNAMVGPVRLVCNIVLSSSNETIWHVNDHTNFDPYRTVYELECLIQVKCYTKIYWIIQFDIDMI